MPIPLDVQQNNLALFQRVTSPLELITEKMKTHGIPIDMDVLQFKAKAWKERMVEHQQKVYDYVGTKFNFSSPKQVKDILYGKGNSNGIKRFGFEPVLKWSKEKREMVETTDQFAFCKLFYENNLPVLKDWEMYNRLEHRYGAFVVKLLRYALCSHCSDKTKTGCVKCAGTRIGDILSHDPRYVTKRNGKYRFHPTLMFLAISGRPISTMPNILQWPRNDNERQIDCRDIVVADDDKVLLYFDLNKAELFFYGFIFDDPAMIELVKMGGRAFSIIASEAFGIPEEKCTKGGEFYHTAKTATYAFIYFVEAQTLHETLAKQGVWIPVDDCAKILETLKKRFQRGRENVMYYTWKWIKERDPFYIVNYQGRRFVAAKSPEFEGYADYKQFIHSKCKARTDFYEMCRKAASFMVQSGATGDNNQGTTLETVDELDRMTNPVWTPNRFENGNWDLVAPLWLKYDELCCEVHEDWIERVKNVYEDKGGSYRYIESYLGRKRLEGLVLGTDIVKSKQWDVKPDKNYEQMTEVANPRHFYRGQVRFKA